MEKLRMAKSAFEQASRESADSAASLQKTTVGLAYLTEAMIDIAAELQEMKTLLNKARKDRNEDSARRKRG